jgi:hypothetical protein
LLRFIGIGAQKAGTSWLHHQLQLHPRVRFPAGKELHFWDRDYPDQPASRYLQHFSADSNLIEGDITPAYAILPLPVVEACAAACPDIKILFILRNPIDRAWSSALMAMRRAELEIHEVSDAWFIDHFRSNGSLLRGDYARTLQTWRAVYGPERVLALDYRDLEMDPVRFLRRCTGFIGLDWCEGWTEPVLRQRVFGGHRHRLPEHLRAVLSELYAPGIEALVHEVDWDPRVWLR